MVENSEDNLANLTYKESVVPKFFHKTKTTTR
jgi:hypothetical protein